MALRRMRTEAGLTHAEMAKQLRISRPTYTRLENANQNTTLKTLNQLCRALRCGVGDLFETAQGKPRSGRARGRKG